MILNLYGGQSTILDIATTDRFPKWPLPSGERDLETNQPNSIRIIIVIGSEFLDAWKRA